MSALSAADVNKWLIPIRKVDGVPDVRLIVFHWVGGNGFVYRPWKRYLPENIEIYSMMMPGRLSRRNDKFVESVGEAVSQLVLCMQALGFTGDNQPPNIFFGHSYGGIIAYELALQLQKCHLLNVAHLVVSSTNCPTVLTKRSQSNDDSFYKKFYMLSDSDLELELINQGALLGGVHIDILRASLPIIRADYKGLETYLYSSEDHRSDCELENAEESNSIAHKVLFQGRLTVWGGSADLHNVSEASLTEWKEHVHDSETCFSKRFFKGSHFYFTEEDAREEFVEELSKIALEATA